MVPTPTPVVLFDFIESGDQAFWREYYAQYENGQIFGFDNSAVLKFLPEPSVPAPEEYVLSNGIPYVGWEKSPELTSGPVDHRVILAYPYCSEFGCFNLKTGGYYNLSWLALEEADYLDIKTGFRYPPSPDSNEDGVTFRISFFGFDSQPQDAVMVEELNQFNDGTVQDWVVPIPNGLVGRNGWFILEVDPGENSSNDYAVWVEAKLIRP
jgi:hypothetical protein